MRSGRTAARARMRHVACAVLAGLVAGGIPAARSAAQAPPAQTPIVIHRLLQSTTTLTGQPLEFPLTENKVTAVLLEAAPGRWNWVLPVEERDGAFKLATVITQLKRGHGIQGMLGLVDGYGLGWHRRQVLTRHGGDVISLPNVPATVDN